MMTIEELIVKLEKLNACREAIAFVRGCESVEQAYEEAEYRYVAWLGFWLGFTWQSNIFQTHVLGMPYTTESELELAHRLFPLDMLLERLEKVE